MLKVRFLLAVDGPGDCIRGHDGSSISIVTKPKTLNQSMVSDENDEKSID